ncbi:MAG: hypothetical protein HW419_1189, partial [Deltaproteobacteria bacterium]|nr:hypothetical protein [Deltaproteobacteria bacterium]
MCFVFFVVKTFIRLSWRQIMEEKISFQSDGLKI